MAKTKSRKTKGSDASYDGVYLLKLVLYLVVGSQWLWFENTEGNRIPVPIGLVVGLVFAMHDHFRIDRKIEYAVLLISMFVGFWIQAGITINY